MAKHSQQYLFGGEPEKDPGRKRREAPPVDPAPGAYAELAVDVPLRRTFFYRISPELREIVQAGSRLQVPFGPHKQTAYYLRAARLGEVRDLAAKGVTLRDVTGVLDETSLLDEPLMALARWMADRYHCSLGEAMSAMVPAGVKRKSKAGQIAIARLAVTHDQAIAQAEELSTRTKHRSPKQAEMLRTLAMLGGRARVGELLLASEGSRSQLNGLKDKGVVEIFRELAEEDPIASYGPASGPDEPPKLTTWQARAVNAVRPYVQAGRHGVFLLHGVTGSGKTEVYLRVIQDVVAKGGGAIVLVPEISLTPQTAERFRARFGSVALLHSHLTDGQRADAWRRIAAGEAPVVIGARSALFAPMPNLGLIVIDEEHESTYKQDTAPRYQAPETARMRARLSGAALILGSATPALESAQLAEAGGAVRLELPKRVAGRPLPPVQIVDMRSETHKTFTILSDGLCDAVDRCLEAGEQVILFLNRRGFSTYIHCARCGFILKCPECDVALTYHRRDDKVLCHYCGREQAPPTDCPECALKGILYHGTGTERIEEVVSKRFPRARLARMDSDTMRDRAAYAKVLGAFRRGETDILIGTQMIAKGLDFPNVTLVGIIKADMALNMADFRASERTFQLIAQVAGRTGRGDLGGRVIVQTWTPENPAIQAAAQHDYDAFSSDELIHRKSWGYPPFAQLARVIFRGKEEDAVRRRAEQIHAALKDVWDARTTDEDTGAEWTEQVLPPAPCPRTQVRGEYRYHLLCRARSVAELSSRLEAASTELDRSATGVQMAIDVDPTNML